MSDMKGLSIFRLFFICFFLFWLLLLDAFKQALPYIEMTKKLLQLLSYTRLTAEESNTRQIKSIPFETVFFSVWYELLCLAETILYSMYRR